MKILMCDQLSSPWFQAHCTNASASHAGDILDFTAKGKEGAKRRLYRLRKAAEFITGIAVTSDRPPTPAMQWGIDTEPEARRYYAIQRGVFVQQVGCVIADIDHALCSPDGLVDDDGAIEIKCPETTTHLNWLIDGVIPEEHLPQCRFALACMSDRQWIDFISFDPRIGGLHEAKRMMVVRLERKDAQIDEMIAAINKFNEDVRWTVERLNEVYPLRDAEDAPAPRSRFEQALEASLYINDSDIPVGENA